MCPRDQGSHRMCLTPTPGRRAIGNAKLTQAPGNHNKVSVGQNPYFRFRFIIPIPLYLKEFGHLFHTQFLSLCQSFLQPPSDNSDEKENTTYFCLVETHTRAHIGCGRWVRMLAEKLRMILCLCFHFYKYLFYQAREHRADFKESLQFSCFSLLDEMSPEPIILPPCTICRQKTFGQTQAVNSRGHQIQV